MKGNKWFSELFIFVLDLNYQMLSVNTINIYIIFLVCVWVCEMMCTAEYVPNRMALFGDAYSTSIIVLTHHIRSHSCMGMTKAAADGPCLFICTYNNNYMVELNVLVNQPSTYTIIIQRISLTTKKKVCARRVNPISAPFHRIVAPKWTNTFTIKMNNKFIKQFCVTPAKMDGTMQILKLQLCQPTRSRNYIHT